jgi:hypothetical protein
MRGIYIMQLEKVDILYKYVTLLSSLKNIANEYYESENVKFINSVIILYNKFRDNIIKEVSNDNELVSFIELSLPLDENATLEEVVLFSTMIINSYQIHLDYNEFNISQKVKNMQLLEVEKQINEKDRKIDKSILHFNL